MLIAVEGCCHGDLDVIYESLRAAENTYGAKVELLLICGDFQATRNRNDLESLACPPKYRQMGDFEKYYRGVKEAPVLTIFIGGNHEASNHLWENYYGGWVAKNIYFMGHSGVVQAKGLTIAGMSGIYKDKDFYRGYTERPPYGGDAQRSIYHVRDFELAKMKAYSGPPVDIVLTHDWPRGIYEFGNKAQLVRRKPAFKDEVNEGSLGSPVARELLDALRPPYFFSGHLHVQFPAVVDWSKSEVAPVHKLTQFLALDKCLPGRSFLQVIDVPNGDASDVSVSRPIEWLAVLKASDSFFPANRTECRMAPLLASLKADVQSALGQLREKLGTSGVPVPSWDPAWAKDGEIERRWLETDHPQTRAVCDLLGIENKIKRPDSASGAGSKGARLPSSVAGTRSQLASIQGGLTDANKLLDDLLNAPQPPAPGNQTAPPPNQGEPNEPADDGELFQIFVDT
ncbi:Lariat debranching enzyme [Diplonema papillatum]|nr:Lariat debranching enzyme [Diplonema papillatum]WGM50053.1 DBR1 [Diplonema papillatum]|eukprot:gene19269-29683_t